MAWLSVAHSPAYGPPAHFLLVMIRRVALGIALHLVVIDPELRVTLCHEIGDALHRGERLVLVDIEAGDPPVVPIVPEMRGIAAQDQPSGLGQMHEQRLMAGVWPGVEMSTALPSPNTSLSPSSFMVRARTAALPTQIRTQRSRIAVGRKRPIIFGLLDQQRRRGKHIDIADMVGMGIRHGDVTDVRRSPMTP
jgi:hypothetical protein